MGSWVYAATLVAVIAMTLAEGLAEESDLSASAEKWTYIPDAKTEDQKQQKATELLQKSQKGRWVNVPAGKTVMSVVKEEELLQAKILADAGKARKAAELKGKATEDEERIKKATLKAKDKALMVKKEMAKAKLELTTVKATVPGTSAGNDFSAMQATLATEEKLRTKVEKLATEKKKLDNIVEEDRIAKEVSKKKVIKQAKETSQAKAETELLKIKEMMVAGSSKPGEIEEVLQQYKKQAADDLKEADDYRLKESRSFNTLKGTEKKVQALTKKVNALKAATDVTLVDVKINQAKTTLQRYQQADEKNHVNELNAKDKLSTQNTKQDLADRVENRAVRTLQKDMKRAEEKKADVAKGEASLVKALATATAQKQVYAGKVKTAKAESKKLLAVLEKAQTQAAKENAVKTNQTKLQASSDEIKQKMVVIDKKIKIAQHDVAVDDAHKTVAALAVNEAQAKSDAAENAKEKTGWDEKVSVAKRSNSTAVLKFEQAKVTLAANERALTDATEKEAAAKKGAKDLTPAASVQVDVAGPDLQYEVAQKALAKDEQKFTDASVSTTTNKQLVDSKSARVNAKLESVKADQVNAVKKARQLKRQLKVDKVSEAGAKTAEKITEQTSEASAAKVSEQNGLLLQLQEERKLVLKPALLKKLDEAKQQLAQATLELEAQKEDATRIQDKRHLAVHQAEVTKYTLQKAVDIKKEVDVKLNMKETDTKDDVKRRIADAGGEKDSKAAEKMREENELSEKNDEQEHLHKEQGKMEVQVARATAAAEELKASAAAMKADETSAQERVESETTKLMEYESAAHVKHMALSKAEIMRKESKDHLQAALQAEAEALKNANIAKSEANVAKTSQTDAEEALETANQDKDTRKKLVVEGQEKLAGLSQQLLDARAELESNKEAADKAWKTEDQTKLIEAAQQSQTKVNKVQKDLDAQEQRNEVLSAAYDTAKAMVATKEAELETLKKSNAATLAKEKMNLDQYSKSQAISAVRAQQAESLLKRIDDQISLLKKEVDETDKRHEEAKKAVANAKALAEKDANKVDALDAEANSAHSELASLEAAEAVKLDADKTTMEAHDAAAANADVAKTEADVSRVESAMSDEKAALTATTAEIQALSGELKTVNKDEDAVSGAAFQQATGGNAAVLDVAKAKTRLLRVQRELGQSLQVKATLVKGNKLSQIIQGLATRKAADANKALDKSKTQLRRVSSEAAIKHHEEKKVSIQQEIVRLKLRTSESASIAKSKQDELVTLKTDLTKALEKVQTLKTRMRETEELLDKARAEKVGDLTRARSAPQGSPNQVRGTMGALSEDAKVKDLQDKINDMQLTELTPAENAVQKLQKNLRSVTDEAEDAVSSSDANKSLLITNEEKLKALGTHHTRIKAAQEEVLNALDTAKHLLVMQKESEKRSKRAAVKVAHSASKVVKITSRYLEYKQQLKESLNLKESNEAAAEKASKDEANAKAIQDRLTLEKSKEHQEKVDIKGDVSQDARLKEILQKKEETATAMKVAAQKAAQREQADVAQQNYQVQSVNDQKAIQQVTATPLRVNDPKHVDNVVGQLLSQIDIPTLVERSKMAMANIVSAHHKTHADAAAAENEANAADEAKEKAKAKEEAADKARMDSALEEQKAAAETGEKAKKKADDMAALIKQQADEDQANAEKLEKERRDASDAVTDATKKYEEAKQSSQKAVAEGDAGAIKTAEAKLQLAKLLVQNNAKQLKEMNTAVHDAAQQASDATADAEATAKREQEASNERAEEIKKQADKDVKQAAKEQLETEENNAPPATPKQNAKFVALYQKALDAVNGKIVQKGAEPPPWAESQAKVAALVSQAKHEITKIQEHNTKTMAETKKAAASAKEDAANKQLSQASNAMKAEGLAKEAETVSANAQEASKNVAELQKQLSNAQADGTATPAMSEALNNAKAQEQSLTKVAEDTVSKAQEAAKEAGQTVAAAEGQGEIDAKLEKLKADNAEATANAAAAAASAKTAAAEAEVAAAQKAASDAAASGNAAAAAAAAAHVKTAAAEAAAEGKAASDSAATAAVAQEEGKAKAVAAAAASIEKPKDSQDIPEVKAITPAFVKAIVDDHVKSVVTDAHGALPKIR